MQKLFIAFFLLAGLLACDGNTAARKAARGPNFVAAPDHIYFKNIRARYYRAEEVTQRATIYRHDDLFDSAARLRPVLIDNWLQDRALIRFETEPGLTNWTLEVGKEDVWSAVPLTTPPLNKELADLSDLLLGNASLRLVSPQDTITAFPDDAGRTEARFVLNDFLRMVAYQP
jgi:hypothetical protein